MEDVAELGMEGAFRGVDHWDKIRHPQRTVRDRFQNRGNKGGGNQSSDGDTDDEYDSPDRRRQGGNNRQQPRGRRPGMNRRTSSLDRGAYNGRGRKGGGGQSRRRRDEAPSEEEASTTEEESEHRKMRGKQVVTAGLAAVSSIWAANKVYTSLQERNQRKEEVASGEKTGRVAKSSIRLKDVASVAIAGMYLKSAYGEWKDAQDKKNEADEHREAKERHKEKRAAKTRHRSRNRSRSRHAGGRRRSETDLTRR